MCVSSLINHRLWGVAFLDKIIIIIIQGYDITCFTTMGRRACRQGGGDMDGLLASSRGAWHLAAASEASPQRGRGGRRASCVHWKRFTALTCVPKYRM